MTLLSTRKFIWEGEIQDLTNENSTPIYVRLCFKAPKGAASACLDKVFVFDAQTNRYIPQTDIEAYKDLIPQIPAINF